MPHDPKRQELLIGSHRACGVKLLPIVADGEPLVVAEFFIGHGQRVRIALSKEFAADFSLGLMTLHSSSFKKEGVL